MGFKFKRMSATIFPFVYLSPSHNTRQSTSQSQLLAAFAVIAHLWDARIRQRKRQSCSFTEHIDFPGKLGVNFIPICIVAFINFHILVKSFGYYRLKSGCFSLSAAEKWQISFRGFLTVIYFEVKCVPCRTLVVSLEFVC